MNIKKQSLKSTGNGGVVSDTHICGQCSSVFLTIKSFLSHKKKGCGSSQVENNSKTNASGHQQLYYLDVTKHSESVEQVKTDEKKKYVCDEPGCKYSTKYPKDLQRHVRIHTGERPYQCEECGKGFSRLDKFKLHSRSHSGVKPFKCKHCDYASVDGSSLKKHVRIHSNERPFKCQICMYASRNSSQLVVHLRTHTGDTPFHCSHCPSKFKINSDLKRHLRLHTGDKPYKCEQCDYRCAVKGNLTTHVRLNHSQESVNRCQQCDFSSPSKRLLAQHEKSHSTNAQVHCPHQNCPYKCNSEVALKNHLRSHSEEKPFKCVHCDYTSRQPGNLRSHIRNHHREHDETPLDGEERPKNGKSSKVTAACSQPHKCTLCPSSFVRQDSLRSHLRQHQKLSEASTQLFTPEDKAVEVDDTTTITLSDPTHSVFSFFPAGETCVVGTSSSPQQQLVYQIQPGVNVLSIPQNAVQYVFQTSKLVLQETVDPKDLQA